MNDFNDCTHPADRHFCGLTGQGGVAGHTKKGPHIGQLIREKLAEQGRTTVWLARELGCHRTNLYKIYDKASIDTGVLLRISRIMGFNFFALYEGAIPDGDV